MLSASFRFSKCCPPFLIVKSKIAFATRIARMRNVFVNAFGIFSEIGMMPNKMTTANGSVNAKVLNASMRESWVLYFPENIKSFKNSIVKLTNRTMTLRSKPTLATFVVELKLKSKSKSKLVSEKLITIISKAIYKTTKKRENPNRTII